MTRGGRAWPVPVRLMAAGWALVLAGLAVAACTHGGGRASPVGRAAVRGAPERIVPAPKSLLAAAQPQANGIMWTLAGQSSTGLFEVDSSNGQVAGSVSVSSAAHSVAESSAGVLGLALGTGRSGALELMDGRTAKVIQTIALPGPASQVAVGSDGTTFYVLTGRAGWASVLVMNSRTGKVQGSVPVPADTVAVAPNIQQTALYALPENGPVDEIAIADGAVTAQFTVGDHGRSLALSPDGSTLYVLKGTAQVSNIAVVSISTESVRRVLPTPRHCVELLVSATGDQLYEVVGTPGYGNIQVVAV